MRREVSTMLPGNTRVPAERSSLSSIVPIFRSTFLEKVARGAHIKALLELAEHLSHFGPPSPAASLSTWFDFFYSLLFEHYRCEYVYKNAIATKLFLSRHSFRTSFMTDELRSGTSRADVAILNGTSTVYEIKSEYDSFERLDGQLADYKRIFDRIYVVTTASKAEVACRIADPLVGIIVMRENGSLGTVRDAISNKRNVNPSAVFDCMRQSEYCSALVQEFGLIPQVPNSKLYATAKEMFCSLPPTVVHDLMVEQIKRRGKKKAFADLIDKAPLSLKHACLSFSKPSSMAIAITERLEEPLINEEILSIFSGQAK